MQDVIVENIKTGQKKSMTRTMAKLLDSKYRILEGETNLDKNPTFTPPSDKSTIDSLKAEYFQLFGQHPHHKLGEARLKELIEEKKKVSA